MDCITKIVYNDGGRSEAGFKGTAGDCCCRAFAIATGKPYKEIYDLINKIGKENETSKKRNGSGRSTARNGVYKDDAKKLAEILGMEWIPTMRIGSGCTMHVRSDELPMGRVVLNVSKHFIASIDGEIHDTYDSTRDGTRCVYGYWKVKE